MTIIFTTIVTLSNFAVAIALARDNAILVTAYASTYNRQDTGGMPAPFSGNEFIIVRDTALSDPKVQKLIDGRSYEIIDCCGFIKDGDGLPSANKWEPVMNIRVADKLQIAIRINMDTQKVTSIDTMPAVQYYVPKSNDDSTATSSVLPLLIIIRNVLGGAAAGMFYYVKRKQDRFLIR